MNFTGDKFFDFSNIPIFGNEGFEKQDYLKYEKGIEFKITHMTPDNYIKNCVIVRGMEPNLYNINLEERMINFDTAYEYATLMKQGVKFPIPFIDFTNGDQEGRHRAYAIKILINNDTIESTKIPVATIRKTTVSFEEKRKYYLEKYHWDISQN